MTIKQTITFILKDQTIKNNIYWLVCVFRLRYVDSKNKLL